MKHLQADNEGILEIAAKSRELASYLADMDNYYRIDYKGDYLPSLYQKKINQKKYQEDRSILYDHNVKLASRISTIKPQKDKRYEVFTDTREFFSALFYMRKLNESSEFHIDVASIPWLCKVERKENQKIKTFKGKVECRKFLIRFEKINNTKRERTDMLTNNLVREENELYFWITDDDERIPVKAEYKKNPFSVYWKLHNYEKK
jgi:hypothetical protein